jgi:hypothetical protein
MSTLWQHQISREGAMSTLWQHQISRECVVGMMNDHGHFFQMSHLLEENVIYRHFEKGYEWDYVCEFEWNREGVFNFSGWMR